MHHRGWSQRVGAAVHQRLGTGCLAFVLSVSWCLVTLGIQQEVGIVRLHAHTSVRHELTMLRKGAEGPSSLITLQSGAGVNVRLSRSRGSRSCPIGHATVTRVRRLH